MDTVDYTPSFTYHGFRHVELVATQLLPGGGEGPLPASLQASFPWGAKIVAHRAHTDMPPLTALNLNRGANSEMISKIFNATIAAHVSNVWSIPTGTGDPLSQRQLIPYLQVRVSLLNHSASLLLADATVKSVHCTALARLSTTREARVDG